MNRDHFLLAVLGACVLLSAAATPVARNQPRQQGQRTRIKATPTPTPAATPSMPTVEFQALPAQDSVGRGETLIVFLFVSNKSNVTLGKLNLNIKDPAFEMSKPPIFPSTLAPFGNVKTETILKVSDGASFVPHKLLFTLEYAWDTGAGQEAESAQPATVAVHVTRRFEEEAKGFPGGTAAFLYLLLPIIPAMFSYQFFEGLRKGQLTLPSFKAEYVVPAFSLAVVLSVLMVWAFKRDNGLNYSDPWVFTTVLLVSLTAGAIVPVSRWVVGALRMRRWGFNNTDTSESYLRKALLAPGTPREFFWVTGKANDEQWTGILLKQPTGASVLGAQLEVSPAGTPGDGTYQDRLDRLKKNVFGKDGVLMDRQLLVQMLEEKELILGFRARVLRGAVPQDEPVVIDEVRGFKQVGETPPQRPIILLTN